MKSYGALLGPIALIAISGCWGSDSTATSSDAGTGETTNADGSNGEQACQERTDEIAQRVDEAIAGANTECTVDADCTRSARNTFCYDACSGPPVAARSYGDLQDALDAIGTDLCPDFLGAGCKFSIPPCPPPSGVVSCVEGTCDVLYCFDQEAKITEQVQQVVDTADRRCSADSDCTALSLVISGCLSLCSSGPVSMEGADAINAVLDEVRRGSCESFMSSGCPWDPPPCPGPGPTKCVSGTCEWAL